jgi:outer membrane protein OmpA-like peptidoglycan-associated protein
MRKWFVVVAMSVFLAGPLVAQEKSKGTTDGSNGTSAAADKNAAADKSPAPGDTPASSDVTPQSGVFALPATPRPTPFPGPADATKDTRSPGMLTPRVELAFTYDYVNFAPGNPFANFNNNGGAVAFTYNFSRWIGLVAEVGGYQFTRNAFPLTGSNNGVSGGFESYLFGPRLNLRKFNRFVPFGEFLIGGASAGSVLVGAQNQSAFAIAAGGGVDIVFTKNIAWRFAQLDYLMTTFSGSALGSSSRQNNFRAATGLVLRFGFPAPPPPPNHPPVASCAVNPASVYAGSGDSVAVHVTASDPDNDPLTYSYSATGGAVDGTGADARWNSSGVAVGSYTVSVKVDDGKGGTASCSADIKVEEKPNRPPVASCSTDRSPITVGERTGITTTASDPDGDPLSYSYTTSGGQINGSGPKVEFDSTGLQPGMYTVKCAVSDGRGGTAEGSTMVEVKESAQIKQLETKLALHSIYFPTALPSVSKPNGGLEPSQAATLDTLASDFLSYLKFRPNAHLILEGHADIRGAKDYNMKLSERRVARAKNYLIEKGVPADHIDLKAFGFEQNMTDAQVKAQIEADTDLNPEEKAKILKNLTTVRLASNRRVDVTLSTTGEQSVRKFPFNSRDALTLLSRGVGGAKGTTPPPAPKKKANP